MDTIGTRLKQWRKDKGLTMTDISTATGLSTGGLSAYERDEKLIGAKPLLALWKEYGLNIAWLLTGETSSNLSADEEQLLELYRMADSRGKRSIMRNAEAESQEQQSSTLQTS